MANRKEIKNISHRNMKLLSENGGQLCLSIERENFSPYSLKNFIFKVHWKETRILKHRDVEGRAKDGNWKAIENVSLKIVFQ